MIAYIHKTSARSRSFRISIQPTGEVIVTTPKWYFPGSVEKFVLQNQAWIERNVSKVLAKKTATSNDQSVMIFGQEYEKKVEYSTQHSVGIRIENQTLVINPIDPNNLTKAKEKELIGKFLKSTAEKYIVPRTHQLSKTMKTSFTHITLREQKTRWGSCSSRGALNFNWRLVHYAPEIIDYVIIHELAHRTHMNHSASFWNLVAKYDPEHLKHRGWLKRHGMSVG